MARTPYINENYVYGRGTAQEYRFHLRVYAADGRHPAAAVAGELAREPLGSLRQHSATLAREVWKMLDNPARGPVWIEQDCLQRRPETALRELTLVNFEPGFQQPKRIPLTLDEAKDFTQDPAFARGGLDRNGMALLHDKPVFIDGPQGVTEVGVRVYKGARDYVGFLQETRQGTLTEEVGRQVIWQVWDGLGRPPEGLRWFEEHQTGRTPQGHARSTYVEVTSYDQSSRLRYHESSQEHIERLLHRFLEREPQRDFAKRLQQEEQRER